MNLSNGSLSLSSKAPTGDELSILFAGDFAPIGRTESAILAGNSSRMAAPLRESLSQADLAIVNLEAPLTLTASPIPKTGPNLKGDPRAVEFLKAAGFDVASLANNHIRDQGDDGIRDTLGILDREQIAHVGAGLDAVQAARPLFLERNGRTIGILTFAENEFSIAGRQHAGAASLDPVQNLQQIQDVAKKADVTLVIVHGGNEYCPVPNPRTMANYRAFARAGASAVVATHTHCPQGIELIDGVPIAYSLGNFLFDSPFPDRPYQRDDLWWKGFMLRLDFDGHAAVRLEVVPTDTGPDATGVQLMTGKTRSSFLAYLSHLSALLRDEHALEQLWQAWCFEQGPWWLDYLRGVGTPVEVVARSDPENLMVLRNGFTCEAHYEVLKTYFSMLWDGVPAPTPALIEQLRRLQRGQT